jgi:hypothetical protein
VDERHPRDHPLVLEVGEVVRQLQGGEHALVDDRAAREAGDREARHLALLDHPTDHVELALEGVLVLDAVGGGHEQLPDAGRAGARHRAAVLRLDRHVAPADHALALVLDGALDQPLGVLAGVLVVGQEADGHAVAPGLGQLEPGLGAQEGVG